MTTSMKIKLGKCVGGEHPGTPFRGNTVVGEHSCSSQIPRKGRECTLLVAVISRARWCHRLSAKALSPAIKAEKCSHLLISPGPRIIMIPGSSPR